MSRKSRCDIYIDQITHGYGNNSIECWAMGIPVVTGWSDPSDRARFVEETGWEPPFIEADNLEAQLIRLIDSADLRDEYGARGRAFAEQFHAEEKVVERLKPVYENAPPTKGRKSLKRYETAQESKRREKVFA